MCWGGGDRATRLDGHMQLVFKKQLDGLQVIFQNDENADVFRGAHRRGGTDLLIMNTKSTPRDCQILCLCGKQSPQYTALR